MEIYAETERSINKVWQGNHDLRFDCLHYFHGNTVGTYTFSTSFYYVTLFIQCRRRIMFLSLVTFYSVRKYFLLGESFLGGLLPIDVNNSLNSPAMLSRFVRAFPFPSKNEGLILLLFLWHWQLLAKKCLGFFISFKELLIVGLFNNSFMSVISLLYSLNFFLFLPVFLCHSPLSLLWTILC